MGWAMVDRIESMEPGVRVVGVKTFPKDAFFFDEHFPGFPTVPGVLEIEMIAQTAFTCIRRARPDAFGMLTHVRSARFINRIGPGEECHISAEITRLRRDYALVNGVVTVNGVKSGEAEILLAVKAIVDTPVHAGAMEKMRGGL
jgi:3-hydroxyacyl-[acyl-carrier-protein] dehydratase